MTTMLRAIGAGELALRLAAHRGRGDWAALVVQTPKASDVEGAIVELSEELESLGAAPVTRLHAPDDALALAAMLADAAGPVVVGGVDSWPDTEWQHLDELRSRLQRTERTVLVLSSDAFEMLVTHAPNLASWIASAWTFLPNAEKLTDEERSRRLAVLREWSGMSDEEMLERRQNGRLPLDPEYAIWLILLGRGDLLGR